jgi:uncharacterized membrane protein YoaT (DUF817 family)
MTVSKTLSALVALAYIGIALLAGAGWETLKLVAFLVLPLACIWFSEEMGSFTGIMRGQFINAQTPGCLVAFGGWLLLLLPVIIGAVQHISAK